MKHKIDIRSLAGTVQMLTFFAYTIFDLTWAKNGVVHISYWSKALLYVTLIFFDKESFKASCKSLAQTTQILAFSCPNIGLLTNFGKKVSGAQTLSTG